MQFIVCVVMMAGWTTYRANNQRTGYVSGKSNFYLNGPGLLAHWIVHSSGNSNYCAPLNYDQTGDGNDDIYISSYSTTYPSVTLYRGYDAAELWNTSDYGDAYYSTGALLSIDYDPYPEVFLGFSGSGGIRCYDGGDGSRVWWNSSPGSISYSSPLAFADPSNNFRVAVGCDTGTLYYMDANTGITLWTYDAMDTCLSAPALGDLNGDGNEEMVYTTKGHIYVLDLAGNLMWDVAYGSRLTTPALANMDGVIGDEIVVYDAVGGNIAVFQYGNPTPLWTYFVGAFADNYHLAPSPGVGDVNANGIPDVVIHNGRTVYCVENGSPLWFQGVINPSHVLYGSPVLADLDGASVDDAGALEIVITGDSSSYGVVYYLQDDGSVEWTWSNPTYSYYEIYNEAALGDPDGDGLLEISVVDYSCYAFILDGTDPLSTRESQGRGIRAYPGTGGLVLLLSGNRRVYVNFYDVSGRRTGGFSGVLPGGRNLIQAPGQGVLFYDLRVDGGTYRGKILSR